jgi:flagellar biosynthesis GTPase FlhF
MGDPWRDLVARTVFALFGILGGYFLAGVRGRVAKVAVGVIVAAGIVGLFFAYPVLGSALGGAASNPVVQIISSAVAFATLIVTSILIGRRQVRIERVEAAEKMKIETTERQGRREKEESDREERRKKDSAELERRQAEWDRKLKEEAEERKHQWAAVEEERKRKATEKKNESVRAKVSQWDSPRRLKALGEYQQQLQTETDPDEIADIKRVMSVVAKVEQEYRKKMGIK